MEAEEEEEQHQHRYGANVIRRERPGVQAAAARGRCCINCKRIDQGNAPRSTTPGYPRRSDGPNEKGEVLEEHAHHSGQGRRRRGGGQQENQLPRRHDARRYIAKGRCKCACECPPQCLLCTCNLLFWKLWILSRWPTPKAFTEALCSR